MGTPTYTLISETVLGSAQASVTFSSIPQTYKDLVLEAVHTDSSVLQGVLLRLNGDTGTNYSRTIVYGTGTSAASFRASNANAITVSTNATTEAYTTFIHLMSYANTNINKTILYRNGAAGRDTTAGVGLWRSTSAITSTVLLGDAAGNFATGSTFRLWGVVG